MVLNFLRPSASNIFSEFLLGPDSITNSRLDTLQQNLSRLSVLTIFHRRR